MLERRTNATKIELRSASNPGSSAGTLIGYASVFSTKGNKFGMSSDLGGFFERVDRRAFDRVLADPNLDTKFLINHDPNQICSRTKNGTLKMMTDSVGLRVVAEIAPTTFGKDLVENVRNGNISEMSFGFVAESDDWSEETDPETGATRVVRTLLSIRDLLDTSAVVYPAYPDTQLSSMNPALLGRSIPESVPVELRSRILRARASAPRVADFSELY